ncbi:MAG: hypothetical protein MJ252_02460 [archaeon]|nr:hypothetical protein [archaeon]
MSDTDPMEIPIFHIPNNPRPRTLVDEFFSNLDRSSFIRVNGRDPLNEAESQMPMPNQDFIQNDRGEPFANPLLNLSQKPTQEDQPFIFQNQKPTQPDQPFIFKSQKKMEPEGMGQPMKKDDEFDFNFDFELPQNKSENFTIKDKNNQMSQIPFNAQQSFITSVDNDLLKGTIDKVPMKQLEVIEDNKTMDQMDELSLGLKSQSQRQEVTPERIFKYIEDYRVNQKFKFDISNLTFFNWLKAFSLVTNSEVQNVDYALKRLKDFSFNSRVSVCEVKEICLIDCIQVLTVVDINLKCLKLVVIKDEEENIKYENENLSLIINDYHFREGNMLICKLTDKALIDKDFYKISLREVQVIC